MQATAFDVLSRRQWLLLLAGSAAIGLPVAALQAQSAVATADLPTLGFLGFELVDDQPDPARHAALAGRLALVGDLMAKGLTERGLYRVLDLTPASAEIARARDENEFLHRCNGCLTGVGEALGTPLVGVGWVQRVSNLILNINLAVWHVADDRMTLTKSVDIRGDNDESWRRGVLYMLRDMAERRARQPRYGL
ncbi:MAG: DUF3280 domain-containing protein [Leptothrix sp. (in: b-proteobacteria)]